MAALSDQLLVVAVLAYAAAMICHAAEYAFVTRPARRPAQSRVPAAAGAITGLGASPEAPVSPAPAGGATAVAASPTGPDPAPGGAPLNSGAVRAMKLAARLALGLAAVVHLAAVITRGIAADRLPWGNMYEYLLSTTLVGVLAWLWLSYRHPAIRHLGLYVALANTILLGIAGMAVYTPVGPLVPALDSYWFVIHVAAAALATGIFLVGFVTAVMYLIKTGYDRGSRRFPYPIGARLPLADSIERLTFRLHAFAFPIWTFAVVSGAIWAEASWGRYWGWDPKEVWAFITWVLYAAYLHARATPSVKRRVAVGIAVAGWLTMLMNLFGVNIFFEGLHSYA